MKLSNFDRWLTEQPEPQDPPEGWVDPGPDEEPPGEVIDCLGGIELPCWVSDHGNVHTTERSA